MSSGVDGLNKFCHTFENYENSSEDRFRGRSPQGAQNMDHEEGEVDEAVDFLYAGILVISLACPNEQQELETENGSPN
jgi:hypothetical protein